MKSFGQDHLEVIVGMNEEIHLFFLLYQMPLPLSGGNSDLAFGILLLSGTFAC